MARLGYTIKANNNHSIMNSPALCHGSLPESCSRKLAFPSQVRLSGCGSKLNRRGKPQVLSMFPLTRVPFWYHSHLKIGRLDKNFLAAVAAPKQTDLEIAQATIRFGCLCCGYALRLASRKVIGPRPTYWRHVGLLNLWLIYKGGLPFQETPLFALRGNKPHQSTRFTLLSPNCRFSCHLVLTHTCSSKMIPCTLHQQNVDPPFYAPDEMAVGMVTPQGCKNSHRQLVGMPTCNHRTQKQQALAF